MQHQKGTKDDQMHEYDSKGPSGGIDISLRETDQYVRSRPEDANRHSDQHSSGPIVQVQQTPMDTPSSPVNSDEAEDGRYVYRDTSYRGGYYSDSSESPKDYTACSASDRGYCGHCGY